MKLHGLSTTRPRIDAWLVAALLVVIVSAGCGHKTSSVPESAPPTTAPPAPVAQNVVPHAPGTLFVYRVALSDSDKRQSDENDLVPVVAPVAVDSRTPMRDALLAQIEIPGSPIPKGSKIRSIRFNQASGLVTVDFSDSFVSKFSGGDTAEAQVVNSVVKTLSQFPGVQSVQFLVHGQKVASLGGTFDLSEPVPTGAAKPASSG